MKIIKIIASCIVLSTSYLSCSQSVQKKSKLSSAAATFLSMNEQQSQAKSLPLPKAIQQRDKNGVILNARQLRKFIRPTTSYESIESLNDDANSDYYLLDEQGREQEFNEITRKFAKEHPDAGCTQS